MATLAEMEAQLAQLRAARAAGERRVEVQGSRVELKPDDELASAISYLERMLAEGGGRAVRMVRVCTSKFGVD